MLRRLSALSAPFIFAASCAALATPALAKGPGGEVNYSHIDGHWGTELGAGYAFDAGGFSLTPGVGLEFGNHDTRVFGRVEAAYTVPMAFKFGLGLRIGNEARPYALVAVPILPRVHVQGNLGPHYYGVGLRLGY